MTRAYIGLGSNLDQPQRQVRQALGELGALLQTRSIVSSRLYLSAPMGPPDQPDYINAVAGLETTLGSYELLTELQAIEQRHGRIRRRQWGERTLDLDLLLYGDSEIKTPELIVPHPGLHQRAFVLCPLAEIAPEVIIPGYGRVADLAAQCSCFGLRCLEDNEILL
jgi:2-amino-4-hydroxy-6-hydroxymethyldihydropteridine diphosphokinase